MQQRREGDGLESLAGSNKTFATADKVNATKKDNSKDGVYIFIS